MTPHHPAPSDEARAQLAVMCQRALRVTLAGNALATWGDASEPEPSRHAAGGTALADLDKLLLELSTIRDLLASAIGEPMRTGRGPAFAGDLWAAIEDEARVPRGDPGEHGASHRGTS
jgi:hypothetical protein